MRARTAAASMRDRPRTHAVLARSLGNLSLYALSTDAPLLFALLGRLGAAQDLSPLTRPPCAHRPSLCYTRLPRFRTVRVPSSQCILALHHSKTFGRSLVDMPRSEISANIIDLPYRTRRPRFCSAGKIAWVLKPEARGCDMEYALHPRHPELLFHRLLPTRLPNPESRCKVPTLHDPFPSTASHRTSKSTYTLRRARGAGFAQRGCAKSLMFAADAPLGRPCTMHHVQLRRAEPSRLPAPGCSTTSELVPLTTIKPARIPPLHIPHSSSPRCGLCGFCGFPWVLWVLRSAAAGVLETRSPAVRPLPRIHLAIDRRSCDDGPARRRERRAGPSAHTLVVLGWLTSTSLGGLLTRCGFCSLHLSIRGSQPEA
ncbi:hypothetical protein C8Q73DRAFT_186580 [Cubamyces lactineus]|nr:hypothetical protein C8Q73DRAFT_186580 [Cubamyces lactineus]